MGTLTLPNVRRIFLTPSSWQCLTANDFESEFQMAQVNQRLAPDIDLVFFMASHQYTYFSSTRVRELASLGADVSWLVPPHVTTALQRVYADRRHGG